MLHKKLFKIKRYPTDFQVYFYRLHNALIPEKAIDKIVEAANRFYEKAHESKNEKTISESFEIFSLTIKFLREKNLPDESLKFAEIFLKKEANNEVNDNYAKFIEPLINHIKFSYHLC